MILPIATRAGIDPIHLGVVMSYNLSLGLVTPPFGSVMFVVCGISRTTIVDFSQRGAAVSCHLGRGARADHHTFRHR